MLNQETLMKFLKYDQDSGEFSRRIRVGRYREGSMSGSKLRQLGYVMVHVDGARYYAHRLAFLYMTGAWPIGDVDHINGNGFDNRFSNLRQVSHAINQQNRRAATSANKSGVLGVSKKRGKFIARISLNGKEIYVGSYKSADEAHAAYLSKKRQLHEGCTL